MMHRKPPYKVYIEEGAAGAMAHVAELPGCFAGALPRRPVKFANRVPPIKNPARLQNLVSRNLRLWRVSMNGAEQHMVELVLIHALRADRKYQRHKRNRR